MYIILANTMEGTTVLGPYTDGDDANEVAKDLVVAEYDNAFVFELGKLYGQHEFLPEKATA